jgi:mono/diheme cytochrome c family protein
LEKSEIDAMLLSLHEISEEMEPFPGSDEERGQLTEYFHRLGNPESAEVGIDGALLFEESCSACHVPEDLSGGIIGLDTAEIVTMLRNLNQISEEMEPYDGSDAEAEALANYMQKIAGEEQ